MRYTQRNRLKRFVKKTHKKKKTIKFNGSVKMIQERTIYNESKFNRLIKNTHIRGKNYKILQVD